ncbi:cytochrome c oxidase subunit II [Flavihumibacter solisilvae]|jgi:cytochrome c oxidase subunit 2|uniref:Cytochrome c oxidase subunit 2 n=1 Tax=Flavihumibacter solisilvae TaxID=1349421 RepID=A0A0C1IQI4_9BACT|nr:cytochrome c oxidase subunit II [Flavihumibacter solisilvae]KIC96460.1 cytochrome C oxidase subunit II [Flavihumibacter solisilvae]
MSTLLIIAILLLGFIVVFQIAKASEYVSVLKGEKKTFEQNNRINGFLLLAFLIVGLIGVYWCNELFKGKILGEAASDHGEKIDTMLYITIAITGIVFLVTQILLFVFAFKYQYSEKRTAFYYPHNNKLEVIWTVVPAIALTVLVGFGLYYWFKITGDAPKEANVVEITGKQFGWIYRYPGKDKVFGKKYYKDIDEGQLNQLGLKWDDKASHDDIVTNEALYMVVGKPVKLVINSRDVVHDVGLVHFRMKMDAVPGTPTTMWFTPKYTTAEMKEKTGNPDFEYEISCDQMCGKGHFSMKGIVKVVSNAEYILWLAKQKTNYAMSHPEEVKPAPAATADSTVTAAVNN